MQPKVSAFAISLNVAEPEASARFLADIFGYEIEMQDDGGFFSLRHPDGGSNVIFLRTGLPTFRPAEAAGRAREGLLLVLVGTHHPTRSAAVTCAGGGCLYGFRQAAEGRFLGAGSS